MKRVAALLAGALLAACNAPPPPPPEWSLAVHGGAGNRLPADYSAADLAAIRTELAAALSAGGRVLDGGGTALDAVEAVIVLMEDSPWFNAGRGAVFTHEGRNELDASIMDGHGGQAGAVAGVTRVKNPIRLARRVMEHTPHVLLAGAGAETFAAQQGIDLVDPAYFHTERRWQELQRALEREKAAPAASARGAYYGTVGAVALDRQGRLAAATSTGGMTNKRHGRVGDTPIIGAGTFADARCAVSATGHGEYFIRHAVAHDICARARDLPLPVGAAARIVIQDVLKPAGGEGGVIAMDARGVPSLEFNSAGMARGTVAPGGEPQVAIGPEALGPAVN